MGQILVSSHRSSPTLQPPYRPAAQNLPQKPSTRWNLSKSACCRRGFSYLNFLAFCLSQGSIDLIKSLLWLELLEKTLLQSSEFLYSGCLVLNLLQIPHHTVGFHDSTRTCRKRAETAAFWNINACKLWFFFPQDLSPSGFSRGLVETGPKEAS